MATKSIVLSDISQAELPDDQHARVIVEHPDNNFPIELDVSAEEASKFQASSLRMATITIHSPGEPARTVQMETKVLDRLFAKVDFDAVLAAGRKVQRQQTAARRTGTASKADRVDYTQPTTFGQLHRGRITEAEKELVKAGREQASKNRKAQTGKDIDWNDAKEKARYGL